MSVSDLEVKDNQKLASVALAIPAYNEADGIPGFLADLDEVLAKSCEKHFFVVVNDLSTDDTAEVVAGLNNELVGEVIVENNKVNSGHGPTVLNAYQRALKTGAQWILQVDGDGQFEAEDMLVLFALANEGNKIVTGARSVRFDPWYRKAVTGSLPIALRGLFGVKRRDINCPFRLYDAAVLPEILDGVPADSLTPHVLMCVLEDRSGHQHHEVVVQHRPRRGDSELGTTWRDTKNLIIPKKLLVFLGKSLVQLGQFRRSL